MDATIISCGARKIWQACAEAGPTPAKDAYTGGPFKMARRFAEQTSPANWYILSAKYGLITPEHPIESYNASFATGTAQVTIAEIRHQAMELGLQHCGRVIVLGGAAYRKALESAVGDLCTLEFPFAGMPIGKFMAAVKSCLRGEANMTKSTSSQAFWKTGNVMDTSSYWGTPSGIPEIEIPKSAWRKRKILGGGGYATVYQIENWAVKVGVIYEEEILAQDIAARAGLAPQVIGYNFSHDLSQAVSTEACPCHGVRRDIVAAEPYECTCGCASTVLVMEIVDDLPADPNEDEMQKAEGMWNQAEEIIRQKFGQNYFLDRRPSNLGILNGQLVLIDFGEEFAGC